MNKIDTAVNEIMSARVFVSSKDVCLDKLSAFYALDFSGIRGVANLRERQEVVGSRLAKLGYRWDPSELEFVFVGLPAYVQDEWIPREQRFSKFVRNTRRARSERLYRAVFDFARSYDRNVRTLIKSNEAGFRWGGRGEQVVDWDYYAKSCRYPKKYYNAGVYIDFDNNRIEFETYQGIDVYIPLPKQIRSKNLTFEGLIDGDYFGIRSRKNGQTWVTRYALNEKTGKYRICGYATEVDGYWEHGVHEQILRRKSSTSGVLIGG